MLVASIGLCREGVAVGDSAAVGGVWGGLVLGNALGALFMLSLDRLLRGYDPVLALGQLQGADARKALLIISTMTVHSFAEGVGIGVSFGSQSAKAPHLGVLVASTIAAHNLPEGLAIAMVMVPRGSSLLAATGWAIFSSLPQPIAAVPAFLFVRIFAELLPIGLGFASGAMIFMVFVELLPDARLGQSDVALYTLMLASGIFPLLHLLSQ
jgi:zinc transporter, ZIP family